MIVRVSSSWMSAALSYVSAPRRPADSLYHIMSYISCHTIYLLVYHICLCNATRYMICAQQLQPQVYTYDTYVGRLTTGLGRSFFSYSHFYAFVLFCFLRFLLVHLLTLCFSIATFTLQTNFSCTSVCRLKTLQEA